MNHPIPIDERILSAAKEDNEDLYLEAIEGEHDINHQDGYVGALLLLLSQII